MKALVLALFVSVIQNPPVLSSPQEITKLVEFAKEAHVKVLFVQIYHAGQAWFPSGLADDSNYQKCRLKVGQDPLKLLIHQAHAQGIEVHAWLNLMSLGTNENAWLLKKYGTDILTRNLKTKESLVDYKIDGAYFLEPGDPRVGDNLVKMVKEIVHAYPDLDGIQFDYIRYPDPSPHYGYTTINTERFMKAQHVKTIDDDSDVWKNWKRDQVTQVLMRLCKTVRQMRPHMQVSTTGCMPYARAYYEAFQDWPSWLSTKLIDFVTIMDYSTDPQQFVKWIDVIKEKTGDLSRVRIAVGAYKMTQMPETFEKEFQACKAIAGGCAIFHYGSLLENPALKDILKDQQK